MWSSKALGRWSLPYLGNKQQQNISVFSVFFSQFPTWVFRQIEVPQNAWLIMENIWNTLLKWMIWGYHYFWKHPHKPSQVSWMDLDGTGGRKIPRWICCLAMDPKDFLLEWPGFADLWNGFRWVGTQLLGSRRDCIYLLNSIDIHDHWCNIDETMIWYFSIWLINVDTSMPYDIYIYTYIHEKRYT